MRRSELVRLSRPLLSASVSPSPDTQQKNQDKNKNKNEEATRYSISGTYGDAVSYRMLRQEYRF
jgi:hypothetical protein